MQAFIAHYRSPSAASDRAMGLFEFESEARLGTKANMQDARIRMLELFGKDAVGWYIDKVERKKARETKVDGQLELDFRAPKQERKRKYKKEYW